MILVTAVMYRMKLGAGEAAGPTWVPTVWTAPTRANKFGYMHVANRISPWRHLTRCFTCINPGNKAHYSGEFIE